MHPNPPEPSRLSAGTCSVYTPISATRPHLAPCTPSSPLPPACMPTHMNPSRLVYCTPTHPPTIYLCTARLVHCTPPTPYHQPMYCTATYLLTPLASTCVHHHLRTAQPPTFCSHLPTTCLHPHLPEHASRQGRDHDQEAQLAGLLRSLNIGSTALKLDAASAACVAPS